MIENNLLNMREAAKILGLKPESLYQWHWLNKHLPFIKIGKALRISEKDLIDFIEKRKRYPEIE